MTERMTVTLPNEYGSDLWSNEHYLSSSENKTWKHSGSDSRTDIKVDKNIDGDRDRKSDRESDSEGDSDSDSDSDRYKDKTLWKVQTP